MARKVLVRLVDDLDGLPGDDVSTVTFSLDGANYQIDLSEANASRLREALAEFVAAGHRTGGRLKRRSGTAARSTGAASNAPAVREWARAQGHDLSDRGRIPANIVEAYNAAQGSRTAKVTAVKPARNVSKPRATKTAAATKAPAAKATAKTATRGAGKTAKTTRGGAATGKAATGRAATSKAAADKTAKTTKAAGGTSRARKTTAAPKPTTRSRRASSAKRG